MLSVAFVAVLGSNAGKPPEDNRAAPGHMVALRPLLPDIYFDTNKAGLWDDARADLRVVAQTLLRDSLTIVVLRGYADWRGPEVYNRELSARRARAVRDFLVDSLGVASDRISTVADGETNAIASCRSDSCWRHDRRVHCLVRLAKYMIHVSSFSSPEKASGDVEYLSDLGLSGRVFRVDLGSRGIWYRVGVGLYADSTDAERDRDIVRERRGIIYAQVRLLPR